MAPSSRAISVPNCGRPVMKARVPSTGSSTQRKRAPGRSRPNSSPNMPCSGKRCGQHGAHRLLGGAVGDGDRARIRFVVRRDALPEERPDDRGRDIRRRLGRREQRLHAAQRGPACSAGRSVRGRRCSAHRHYWQKGPHWAAAPACSPAPADWPGSARPGSSCAASSQSGSAPGPGPASSHEQCRQERFAHQTFSFQSGGRCARHHAYLWCRALHDHARFRHTDHNT